VPGEWPLAAAPFLPEPPDGDTMQENKRGKGILTAEDAEDAEEKNVVDDC